MQLNKCVCVCVSVEFSLCAARRSPLPLPFLSLLYNSAHGAKAHYLHRGAKMFSNVLKSNLDNNKAIALNVAVVFVVSHDVRGIGCVPKHKPYQRFMVSAAYLLPPIIFPPSLV